MTTGWGLGSGGAGAVTSAWLAFRLKMGVPLGAAHDAPAMPNGSSGFEAWVGRAPGGLGADGLEPLSGAEDAPPTNPAFIASSENNTEFSLRCPVAVWSCALAPGGPGPPRAPTETSISSLPAASRLPKRSAPA